MNTQKRWSIIFSLIFFLNIFSFSFAFPKSTQAAAVLRPIGAECDANQDAQCASGDCESSTKDGKWFCDCNTDDDCRIYGQGNWECIDGADATYDLDYCKSGSVTETPIPAKDPSFIDTLLDTELAANEIKKMVSKPVTRITIPGITFSDPTITVENGVTYQNVPYLGEYIVGIYKYSVLAIAIIAVLVIIIAGLIWMTSGGNADKITSAKERIGQALVGVFIAVGSYTLLYIINPELVRFKNLKVQTVDRQEIPDYLSHGDITGGDEASYSGSGTEWTVPGTNERVELSKKDVCYFNTFGQDQTQLNHNIGKACLFGSEHCIKVHKLIAEELQKRFDELAASNNAEIIKWKEHLLNKEEHMGPGNKPFDAITASGAWSQFGHGSDIKFVKKFGGKYNIDANGGGIAITAKANLLKKKLAEDGTSDYVDKNGVRRGTNKKIKTWVANGTHAWGLAFDIDYPHNPYGKTTNFPTAAIDILTRGGFLTWGMGFSDPAHFQYNGPLCK